MLSIGKKGERKMENIYDKLFENFHINVDKEKLISEMTKNMNYSHLRFTKRWEFLLVLRKLLSVSVTVSGSLRPSRVYTGRITVG